jgi:polyferredoxin
MLGPLVTGYFTGRFWCGNICPIGNFFDHVLDKISNHQKAPDFLKSKWIRIFMIFLMMTMFTFEMLFMFGKPAFMGMVFYEMILEAVIIGTFLTVIYHHRTWCHFCPMGSMGAFATFLSRKKKVLYVSGTCTSCSKCKENCPMGVDPQEYKGHKLSSYNCIQCGRCKESCLKNKIH